MGTNSKENKRSDTIFWTKKGRYLYIPIATFIIASLIYSGLIITASLSHSAYVNLIRNPILAFEAFFTSQELSKNPYRIGYWYPPTSDKKGLVTYRPDKAYNGLTLYISVEEPKAMLIDMKGAVIHQWNIPFRELYGETEGPTHLYKWARCHLTPEGNLYVGYDGIENSGLLKLDQNSNILWNYEGNAHHDIAVTDTGLVYTFSREFTTQPDQAVAHIDPPFVEDYLITLDDNGNEIARISLFDAFIDSPAEHVLSQLIYRPTGDVLNPGDMMHPNSIEIIRAPEAGKASMLAEGHLLLSFRNNSLLATLDPATGKITWATYGPWRNQHDPRFLSDGTVIMFDNEGHLGAGGASRIIRVDLETQAILWQFTGNSADPLYSQFNSSVDPLPNGNILATESMNGRLFEVTQAGEIVWDYRTTARFEYEGEILVPSFFRGRRFLVKDLPFLMGAS